jgi:hypothetical protein
MTNNRIIENPDLIEFVRHIHEIHADVMGYFAYTCKGDKERCKRWLDAVLPEVSTANIYELPNFVDETKHKKEGV